MRNRHENELSLANPSIHFPLPSHPGSSFPTNKPISQPASLTSSRLQAPAQPHVRPHCPGSPAEPLARPPARPRARSCVRNPRRPARPGPRSRARCPRMPDWSRVPALLCLSRQLKCMPLNLVFATQRWSRTITSSSPLPLTTTVRAGHLHHQRPAPPQAGARGAARAAPGGAARAVARRGRL